MNQIAPAYATFPAFDSADIGVLRVREYAYGPSGPLPLYADPITDLDAATKRYVDGSFAPKTVVSNATPLDPFTGMFWWSTATNQLNIYTNSGWALANTAPVQSPPSNNVTYARRGESWVPVGQTFITPSPPTASPGDFWWDSADGQLYIRYNDGNSVQWVIANNLAGMRDFVPISGGHMTGWLTLNADPVFPLHAATTQYVDHFRYLSYIDDAPPKDPYPGMLWFDSRSAQLYVWYNDGNSAQWIMANTPTFGCAGDGGAPGGAGGSYFGPNPPQILPRPGDLWTNTAGDMFIWNGDSWVRVSTGAKMTIGQTAPVNPAVGDLWWDNVGGNLYIYYDDGDSEQWVIAVNLGRLGSTSTTTVSANAPANPAQGDFWWDTNAGQLFIWFVDGSPGQWVEA